MRWIQPFLRFCFYIYVLHLILQYDKSRKNKTKIVKKLNFLYDFYIIFVGHLIIFIQNTTLGT